MIQPHGGKLVDRVLKGKAKDEALARAGRLPRLVIDSELVSDVENIATGVYSPLEGFLGEADFRERPGREPARLGPRLDRPDRPRRRPPDGRGAEDRGGDPSRGRGRPGCGRPAPGREICLR